MSCDDLIPGTTRTKKMFDRLPNRCLATRSFRDPGRTLTHDFVGIGRRHRIAAVLEGGKIGEIVAHEGGVLGRDRKLSLNLSDRLALVGHVLEDDLDTKFRHPAPKCLAAATGDHGDMVSLFLPGLDGKTVTNVESLEFPTAGIDQDRSIREDSIDIETQQRYPAGVRSLGAA